MAEHIFRPQAVSDVEEGIVTVGVDITAWLDAAAEATRPS